MEKPGTRIVFQCKKCEHQINFEVDETTTKEKILAVLGSIKDTDCPNCGEEPYDLWILHDVFFHSGKKR